MHASDEKGAIYWLAKMLHAGEDFRFIARRIVISRARMSGSPTRKHCRWSSPQQQAVEFVGLPEARIPFGHATPYMSRAKKRAKLMRC
jgi:putative ATPase